MERDFTLGSMYWINPKYTLDDLRADLRRVKEDHITMLRTFLQWEYIEPRRGVWDFAAYDRFFRAAEEVGIDLMPTLLFYPPFWLTEELAAAGKADLDRRYPCLDRPEIREALTRFFTETVTRYRSSPALRIWNVWNEPTDPPCAVPETLSFFADWLKTKYRDLDDLREAWAGEYYIFNPILPDTWEDFTPEWIARVMELGSRGRHTAMMLDWGEFTAEHSARHVRELVTLVKRIDPAHETHSNPYCGTVNTLVCGLDPWLVAREHESIGVSMHPHHMLSGTGEAVRDYPRPILAVIDLVRSWADGRGAWIGEYQAGSTFDKPNAYTPRRADILSTLFHSLARGLDGVIFWEWQSWRQSFFEPGEFSLRNPSDGGPTERSLAAADFGRFVLENRESLAETRALRPEVAIFHSFDMQNMAYAQDKAGLPSRRNQHTLAALACHRVLADAGIPADFVAECQFSVDVLSRYRVLIVPHVRIVSPATAKALAKFVETGGLLWADGRCGVYDKHLFLRGVVPGNGLDRVFGAREADEVAPLDDSTVLRLNDGRTLPAGREIQRLAPDADAEVLATCEGYPAAVRHVFGKGLAELWGTHLSAGESADAAWRTILLEFVRRAASAPYPCDTADGLVSGTAPDAPVRLVVATSLAKEARTVRVAVPDDLRIAAAFGRAALAGNTLEFTLDPRETAAGLLTERD